MDHHPHPRLLSTSSHHITPPQQPSNSGAQQGWSENVRSAEDVASLQPHDDSADRKRRHSGLEHDRRACPHPDHAHSSMATRRPAGGVPPRSIASASRATAIDFTSSELSGRHPPMGDDDADITEARRASDIRVPMWQPDGMVSKCPVCKTKFGFLYRKHHCRKCGRVVCAACSPHRITIPKQYVVKLPTGGDNVEYQEDEQASFTPGNSALGGGETVRVCNPCVPDPWTPGTLPISNNPASSNAQAGEPTHPPSRNSLQHTYTPTRYDMQNTHTPTRHDLQHTHAPAPRDLQRASNDDLRSARLRAERYHYNPPPAELPGGRYRSWAQQAPPPQWPNHAALPGSWAGTDRLGLNPRPGGNNGGHYPNLTPGQMYPIAGPAYGRGLPPLPPMATNSSHLGRLGAIRQPQGMFNRASMDSRRGNEANRLLMGPRQVDDANRILMGPRGGNDLFGALGRLSPPPPEDMPLVETPTPKRAVREEDECPVCGIELLPDEQLRERHVQECIAARFSTGATPPSAVAAASTGTANARATNSYPAVRTAAAAPTPAAGSRPRATSYRPRGMAVYTATEKDCTTADGEAQECVICLEEFQPGDELGRMECLCKFHRVCIRKWWATKGGGSCPTHRLQEELSA